MEYLLEVFNIYIIINYTLQLLVTELSGCSGLPVARNKSSLPVQRRTQNFVPPTFGGSGGAGTSDDTDSQKNLEPSSKKKTLAAAELQ